MTSHRPSSLNLWPLLAALMLMLLLACLLYADHRAVVRLPSHGASATVIQTAPGRSLLLGCAHAYRGADRTRKHVVDVPSPIQGQQQANASARLLAVDHDLDLSLVELPAGPLPHVLPVAPPGHRLSTRSLLSVGYDGMRWPATVADVEYLDSSDSKWTYTRGHPTPGRSGGALIDPNGGRPVLVGVVLAYEVLGFPGTPRRGRGIYASHAAILRFLSRHGLTVPPPTPGSR